MGSVSNNLVPLLPARPPLPSKEPDAENVPAVWIPYSRVNHYMITLQCRVRLETVETGKWIVRCGRLRQSVPTVTALDWLT